ncbi:hypothetical protein BDA99DRAFT_565858 [Phascolomyces articulosus]|uniref:Uncharacterized protein n=1 Tax=Phascolomyces articulosus TaxID=60185 RepID=A0AAD5P7J9_9FUNG|nr:hypothetical protein BDA99DRAFT_565858 [Phascolomyces articulosus]
MPATAYNKSREITGSDRYIARYLSKSLSSILIAYLAFIRPLECLFYKELYGTNARITASEYLFIANGEPCPCRSIF